MCQQILALRNINRNTHSTRTDKTLPSCLCDWFGELGPRERVGPVAVDCVVQMDAMAAWFVGGIFNETLMHHMHLNPAMNSFVVAQSKL